LPGTSQKGRQRQLDTNSVAPAGAEKSMSTAKAVEKGNKPIKTLLLLLLESKGILVVAVVTVEL
jgi:hypothetical protein